MALPATDNFNRTNANPAGGNWSANAGSVKIDSNTLVGATGTDKFAYWNADTPDNNQYAQCISADAGAYGSDGGPAVRVQTASLGGYGYNIVYSQILKFVSGTYTQLRAFSDTPSGTAVYKIEISSSTITVKKGASTLGSTTDSSHASGSLGLFIYGTVGTFDDWEGGNNSTVVTHATTGALANSGAAIAGTSAHIATHTTTGTLSNSGATIVGAASNFTPHDTSGVLANSGASIVGAASNFTPHATTGALATSGATVSGTSARLRAFSSTGALAGAGAAIAGSATRFRAFGSTGALANSGATIVGSALNFTPHDATGALANSGAILDGVATHTVAGGVHPTEGALVAGGAAIAGTAAHIAVHNTTGALANDGAAIAGSATNYTVHSTTGALVSDYAVLSGSANHTVLVNHETTGALAASGALLSGEALHSFVTIHDTVGALSGWGAEITGSAQNGYITEIQHFSGNYGGYGSTNKNKKASAKTVNVNAKDESIQSSESLLENWELFIADVLMASPTNNIEGTIEIESIQPSEEIDRLHRYRILAAAALLTAH